MSSIEDIINRQFRQWQLEHARQQQSPHPHIPLLPIITVSRETGSRGAYLAKLLAEKLGYQLIHREVIDAICHSSGYRKQMVESLDEHYRPQLHLLVESLISGQAVDHSDYVRHLYQVILSMSQLGGVVLVGRGGNFILGKKRGFHIRVVCPKEKRIANLMKYKKLSPEDATARINRSDTERRAFVRKLFRADNDDPHHYDLIINSEYVDFEELVPGLIELARSKMSKLSRLARESRAAP